VRLPEFMRTMTFRWTLGVSGAFIACILLMFGFVLWHAYGSMAADVDGLINDVANNIATASQQERLERLGQHLQSDPRRVKIGALFTADGVHLTGNIESMPPRLEPNGRPQLASVIRIDGSGREQQTVWAEARRLPNGDILVVGRDDYEFQWIVDILERALAVGLVPALAISFAVGAFLNRRSQQRAVEVNRVVQRFVSGELHQRVAACGDNEPLERLGTSVNGVLDQIETLIRTLAGVGNDIAHDLRTPLTRVRVTLERARDKAQSVEALRASVDQAIGGLDQSLAIITALLRIAEIEHNRRMDGFRSVALANLLHEVGDLYEPIAEDKKVAFAISTDEDVTVRGDRDLLFEAIANLVDNAVKFTPEGGRVEVDLLRKGDDAVVRVRDSGPGILEGEEDLVGRRFYRSEKSRRDPGLGLGLSLVSAIVKLHGFKLRISPGPGCVAEIAGQREAA